MVPLIRRNLFPFVDDSLFNIDRFWQQPCRSRTMEWTPYCDIPFLQEFVDRPKVSQRHPAAVTAVPRSDPGVSTQTAEIGVKAPMTT
jgi:hypothetical protein